MMTTTGLHLCSISSFSSSSSHTFKFPAKERRTKPSPMKSGGKIVESSSSSPTTSINEDSDQHGFRALCRRRELVFTASLPFLIGLNVQLMEEFRANAAVVATEYPTIKEGLRKVLSKGKAAGLLRLVFHDAGTFDINENSGGMNGSIVYELDRPENAGLNKSLKVLEKVKSEIDVIQPVSWADLIAAAGAEAVSVCGGPVIPVQLGRLDSTVPDPVGKLPEESLDASGLKQCFLKKGFTTQELVALSGAHTLGSKGFGNPTVFDNSYFKILMEKPWGSSDGMSSMIGLPSDRALAVDDECLRWIRMYAGDQNKFFKDFKNAYIKLVNSGALWKNV